MAYYIKQHSELYKHLMIMFLCGCKVQTDLSASFTL